MARKLKASTVGDVEDAPEPKRRGKRAPLSNVSDETIAEHYAKAVDAALDLEEAMTAAKSARGIFGAVLKDAKAAGVDTDALRTVLAWRKRETAELDSEIRAVNRIAYIAKLPIGAQLGLFDAAGTSIATAIEDKQLAPARDGIVTVQQLADATLKGKDCGLRGYGPEINPHPDASPLNYVWESGRQAGVVEAARKAYGAKKPEEIAGEASDDMSALKETMQ